MNRLLFILIVFLTLKGVSQDLSPWNAHFVVSSGGYYDTVWFGCDTGGTIGFQQGLDILDTTGFEKPLKIIAYDSLVQQSQGTSACGNLVQDIRGFKDKPLNCVNAYRQNFDFYLLADTNVVDIGKFEFGAVVEDHIKLKSDSSNYDFKNDSFQITSMGVCIENGRLNINFPTNCITLFDFEKVEYKTAVFFDPLYNLTECATEHSKYDFIAKISIGMTFNKYDTTQCFEGVKDHVVWDGQKVKISPNPSNGIFNIAFDAFDNNTTLKVFNSIGEIVLSKQINSKTESIDLSDEPAGIYFVQVINVCGSKKARIVKE